VFRGARRFLRDAQVRIRVELCATEGADDVEDVLPFRVSATSAGADEEEGDEGDEGDAGDEDDEGDEEGDEDDEGGDVVGVAFTLLNAAVHDTDLGAENRGRAAVLQAVIDVFFIGQTKGQRASTVADRVAKVGNGEMARALLFCKQRNFNNDVRIADATFELRLHVARRCLETMPAVAKTLRTSGWEAACAQLELEVRCRRAERTYWDRARLLHDSGWVAEPQADQKARSSALALVVAIFHLKRAQKALASASGAPTAASGASTAASGASTAASGASTAASGASTAASGASTAASGASTAASGASTAASGASTAASGASTAASGASTAASQ